MTKLIFCGKCNDIRVVRAHESTGDWTDCSCGYMGARWTTTSMLRVRCDDQDPNTTNARIIGMHNQFLYYTFREDLYYANNPTDNGSYGAHWRRIQEEILKATDSYYLFSPENRNSWACVIRIGETSDVSWEPKT
jgi:hypothetical protein